MPGRRLHDKVELGEGVRRIVKINYAVLVPKWRQSTQKIYTILLS